VEKMKILSMSIRKTILYKEPNLKKKRSSTPG
jgi:hypothetical protein